MLKTSLLICFIEGLRSIAHEEHLWIADKVREKFSCDYAIINCFIYQGTPTMEFLRKIYKMAVDVSAYASNFARRIFQALFKSLKHQTPLFLAGLFISHEYDSATRLQSLRHSQAYLKASKSSGVDYQTLVPSLISVLNRADTPELVAAMGCVEDVLSIFKSTKEFTSGYQFDSIYGSSSSKSCSENCWHRLTERTIGQLQFLKSTDMIRYLDMIQSYKSDLSKIGLQIQSCHRSHLMRLPGDTKQDIM